MVRCVRYKTALAKNGLVDAPYLWSLLYGGGGGPTRPARAPPVRRPVCAFSACGGPGTREGCDPPHKKMETDTLFYVSVSMIFPTSGRSRGPHISAVGSDHISESPWGQKYEYNFYSCSAHYLWAKHSYSRGEIRAKRTRIRYVGLLYGIFRCRGFPSLDFGNITDGVIIQTLILAIQFSFSNYSVGSDWCLLRWFAPTEFISF